MNVICSMVVTANGCIAQRDGRSVSSSADWDNFSRLASRYNNFVIGRKTLEASPEAFDQIKCEHKIVISERNDFDVPLGFKRFTSPKDAIHGVKGKIDTMLLVGGGELNSSFAEQDLINELILTIEPKIVGTGKKVFESGDLHLNLSLKSAEDLGDDRLRVSYSVV